MGKYNFTPLRRYTLPVLRVTLSKTQMHFPKETFELLGKPQKLLVHFDADAKAIKLEPNSTDVYAREVAVYKDRYYRISVTLAKLLPTGIYPLEDRDQFIFVKESD